MAKNSGKASGAGAIRSLNRPQEMIVRTAEGLGGRPGVGLPEQSSCHPESARRTKGLRASASDSSPAAQNDICGVPEQGSEFFAKNVKKPISLRLHGRWFEVESVEDIWRIDDEWWREEAVSRMYYRCAVDGGMSVTVFHDLINGRWYRQSV